MKGKQKRLVICCFIVFVTLIIAMAGCKAKKTTTTRTITTITTTVSATTTPSKTTTTTEPTYARIRELSSIKVIITPSELTAGSSLQCQATGTYSDGSMGDITSQVVWASSNTDVTSISSTGMASGIKAGSADITASLAKVNSAIVTMTVKSKS
jgi:hypothetical protein